MADIIKDLDILLPEPKQIKVGGKLYEVKPAKLKDFMAVQKLFLSLQNSKPEEQVESFSSIINVLESVVPQIKEMDLTIRQLMALLEFVYQEELTSQPQTTEKKTD